MSVNAILQRAKAHEKRAEFGAAAGLYSSVLKDFPRNARARDALARIRQSIPRTLPNETRAQLVSLFEASQFEKLALGASEILALYPNDTALLELAGSACAKLGRHDLARDHFRVLLATDPNNADAHGHLGNAHLALGDLDTADDCFRAVLDRREDAAAHNNLGQVAVARSDFESAKSHFEDAATMGFAPAWNNLGNILSAEGDIPAAAQAFRKSLQIEETAAVNWNLASLTTFSEGNEQIPKMEALRGAAEGRDRMLLSFALGRAYMALDRRKDAFDSLSEANALRKAELGYQFEWDQTLFAQIKSIPNLSPLPEVDSPTPIFIVGMPRSGTTLIEQVLTAHADISGGGEIDLLNDRLAEADWSDPGEVQAALPDLQRIYAATLEQIAEGRSFVTDKLPLNFRWLGAIRAMFPAAKIVHVMRDARATCWSNFVHFFASEGNGFAYDLDDLRRYYLLYLDVMAFWRDHIPFVDLDYDALTAAPDRDIPALLEALSIPFDAACLAPESNRRRVLTSSSLQVRREIYQGSSKAWDRYSPFVKTAFEGLP